MIDGSKLPFDDSLDLSTSRSGIRPQCCGSNKNYTRFLNFSTAKIETNSALLWSFCFWWFIGFRQASGYPLKNPWFFLCVGLETNLNVPEMIKKLLASLTLIFLKNKKTFLSCTVLIFEVSLDWRQADCHLMAPRIFRHLGSGTGANVAKILKTLLAFLTFDIAKIKS